VDFTREPVIETVITPKEGCKLVVRSSKGVGQEEYFVDAVEVVSFGNCFFYRSLEKPKSFFAPVSDYEILEVRETRLVLKHVGGGERSIKIAGGRARSAEESSTEKVEASETRLEKKRERRRHSRRRRREEREEGDKVEETAKTETKSEEKQGQKTQPSSPKTESKGLAEPSSLGVLLPPPQTLIADTISRYKGKEEFKGAFYSKEEEKEDTLLEEEATLSAEEPEGEQAESSSSERNFPPPPPPLVSSLEEETKDEEQTKQAVEEPLSSEQETVEEVSNEHHTAG